MKMPGESSIYCDLVSSQRSTSGGSSGDACSSGTSSRNYVDPWDLENYAYLRRHSVAGLTQQASRQHRRPSHHLSQDAHSEYWYTLLGREPGYDAPAFVEELYCGPARPANNTCYYHQPIYEDEAPDYVAPFPVCTPLSDARYGEFMEGHKRFRHKCKSVSMSELQRSVYGGSYTSSTDIMELDIRRHHSVSEYRSITVDPEQGKHVQIIPPPHLDLNTYGHLKIDYSNSWNSLNRKIRK